jgi:uncharacterized protein (TIGR02145 family)
MKTKQTLLIMAISLMALAASAQLQYITNISVAQRTDVSGLVDVNFDLVAQPNSYYIYMEVSFDAGETFTPVLQQYTSGDIGPLSPGTSYHIVWDGLASFPETYGPQSQLKIVASICPEQTITDVDGNVYFTVSIGQQCWMKENLKTTKYRNGNSIAYPGSNNNAWESNFSGAYAWYDNDISWKNSYGALYNWWAVYNSYGLCPTGWHVPTDAEWTQLTNFIGGAQSPNGNKLKSCRQVNSPLGGDCSTSEHPRWNQNNTHYGNDLTSFSGLPGGMRLSNGEFGSISVFGAWWSSDEANPIQAWNRTLSNVSSYVGKSLYNKEMGYSVRCLRD